MIRIVLLLSVLAPATHAQQTIDSYRHTNRLLLLFAPDRNDPRFRQQLANLDPHAADLTDRDLIVVSLTKNQVPPLTPDALRRPATVSARRSEQILARRRFKVSENTFTVLLIGKDGGEKFRSNLPITNDQLIQLIDAMPMRQQEIRERKR